MKKLSFIKSKENTIIVKVLIFAIITFILIVLFNGYNILSFVTTLSITLINLLLIILEINIINKIVTILIKIKDIFLELLFYPFRVIFNFIMKLIKHVSFNSNNSYKISHNKNSVNKYSINYDTLNSFLMYIMIIIVIITEKEDIAFLILGIVLLFFVVNLVSCIVDYLITNIEKVIYDEKIKAIYSISSLMLIFISIATFTIKSNYNLYNQYIDIYIFVLTFVFISLSITTFVTSFNSKNIMNIRSIGSVLSLSLIIITLNISCLFLGNLLIHIRDSNAFIGIDKNSVHSLFYYTIMTITSVGYGDITPNSVLSRSWAIGSSLFGFVILTTFISSVVSYSINKTSSDRKRRVNKYKKKNEEGDKFKGRYYYEREL